MSDREIPDLAQRIERQQDDFHLRRIKNGSYGRIAIETKREMIDESVMRFIDWFSALRPVKFELPNVLVKNGDYITRNQISYAIFITLIQKVGSRMIEVESSSQVIRDFKSKNRDSRLRHVRYLILHDVELFNNDAEPLNDLAIARYKNGNSTIFVGRSLAPSDVVLPIITKGITKINAGSPIEMIHEHDSLPFKNRYGN